MPEMQKTRSIFLAAAVAACAALSGCASLDEEMFGTAGQASAEPSTVPQSDETSADDGTETAIPPPAAPTPAENQAAVASPPPAEEGQPVPETSGEIAGPLPSSGGEAAPVTGVPSTPVATASVRITPAAVGVGAVIIAPGADTGTGVGHTTAGLRGGLQEIENQMLTSSQQLASLRNSSSQQIAAYHQASAQIATHLQIGTTRGNPQLVAQWNGAQAALDQLTANLNALNTVGAQLGGESSRARTLLGQIRATYDVAGAVDEDHRQLAILDDEANQILVVLDRLGRDAAADLRRQTAAVARERGDLTQLADAIKKGDLYGAAGRTVAAATVPDAPQASFAPGASVVTIRFPRTGVNYEKRLYAALTQALQAEPGAAFEVVGVSPIRGSAQAVQTAQTDARRHAQDVMHTMTQMGVPATRMDLSSATDPAIRTSEVRVVLR
jgi:hypothetical protein